MGEFEKIASKGQRVNVLVNTLKRRHFEDMD